MKRFFKWLWIVALAYIIVGVLLYFLQNLIIFHPKKLRADFAFSFPVPFREVNVPVTSKKNISIVQFTVPDSLRKGILLYFHGNRENINRYAKFAPLFTKNGYETWMIDYPGYGKSTGKKSEQQLYEDALVMYKMAIRAVPLEQIIIYGKSLGTGIAAQLASVRECKKLILETPYYSMAKLASRFFPVYPVKPFIKYELPTYRYLEYIKCPITLIHGTKDGLIAYKHAVWLAEKKPGTELITIAGGKHNNLAEYEVFRNKIDSLLR